AGGSAVLELLQELLELGVGRRELAVLLLVGVELLQPVADGRVAEGEHRGRDEDADRDGGPRDADPARADAGHAHAAVVGLALTLGPTALVAEDDGGDAGQDAAAEHGEDAEHERPHAEAVLRQGRGTVRAGLSGVRGLRRRLPVGLLAVRGRTGPARLT